MLMASGQETLSLWILLLIAPLVNLSTSSAHNNFLRPIAIIIARTQDILLMQRFAEDFIVAPHTLIVTFSEGGTVMGHVPS
jgi:hypothetical protein